MISLKKSVIALLLILVSSLVVARPVDPIGPEVSSHLWKHIHQYYSVNTADVNHFCEEGMFLVRFKVNARGQVDSLSFSKRSPAFIKKALTTAIKKIEGDTTLAKHISKTGKTIVVPVLYVYQLGCFFNRKENKFVDNRIPFLEKYIDTLSEMNKLPDGVADMLDFDNGPATMVDGIMLRPVVVGAMGY